MFEKLVRQINESIDTLNMCRELDCNYEEIDSHVEFVIGELDNVVDELNKLKRKLIEPLDNYDCPYCGNEDFESFDNKWESELIFIETKVCSLCKQNLEYKYVLVEKTGGN